MSRLGLEYFLYARILAYCSAELSWGNFFQSFQFFFKINCSDSEYGSVFRRVGLPATRQNIDRMSSCCPRWLLVRTPMKQDVVVYCSVSVPDPDESGFFRRSGSGLKKLGSGSVRILL